MAETARGADAASSGMLSAAMRSRRPPSLGELFARGSTCAGLFPGLGLLRGVFGQHCAMLRSHQQATTAR